MNTPFNLFQWVDNLFERFAILELSDEQKQKTAMACTTQMQGSAAYWAQVIISSIIAAFGLLQNSVAVIIGAMLIAPLFKPIQGMAFGIAKGNQSVFVRASVLLLKSIAVSIAISALLVLMVPFNVETSEILARTTPNLLDLLIAIASALIAFLAVYFEELSESIGGVAMATSLMPPLAVVGIQLAFGNIVRSWGSLFLFLTNLFAIVLVGTFMFFLYGFSPHQQESQRSTLRQLGVLCLLGLCIVVPLASSLLNLSDAVNIRLSAQEQSILSLQKLVPQATLSEIELLEHSRGRATLKGTITLPEGTEFLIETQEALQQELSETLERDVVLHLQVLRVASIVTQKHQAIPIEQRIREEFRKQLLELLPSATVVRIDVAQLLNQDVPSWAIKTIVALPPDAALTAEHKTTLDARMIAAFPGQAIQYVWVYLPEQQENRTESITPRKQHGIDVSLQWEQFLQELLPAEVDIQDLQVSWTRVQPDMQEFSLENIQAYSVQFTLLVPEDMQPVVLEAEQNIEEFRVQMSRPTTVSYRVVPYASVILGP